MRFLLVVAVFVAIASALPARNTLYGEFQIWQQEYGKIYENEVEEETRYNIFKANAEYVAEHNERYSQGLETFELGMNKFADMTHEEFKAERLSKLLPDLPSDDPKYTGEGASPPATQNWTALGWVTPVKDQGQCGSCWSFSATGGLEGQYYNSTGQTNLTSMSEQQLVSCDKLNFGCNGGNIVLAYRYWINHQSNTEASYPYTSGTGVRGACETSGKPGVTNVAYTVQVTSDQITALESAVGLVGPVSVAIDASHLSFQLYKSGIYSDNHCSSTSLDHAVLAVGYNQDSQGQFWIVKNSWGTGWGIYGYFWLAKDDNNMCGILTSPSFPIV